MPYNTRRKSLSLPSLGIHIPVTHAARDAARAAAASTSTSTSPSKSHRLSSSSSSSPPLSSSTVAESTESHPSKRLKRSHSGPPPAEALEQTPPPSPTLAKSVEMTDAPAPTKIDLQSVNDDIVEAVIVQLQTTGNRPHLVKDLATVLGQTLSSVQHSANPCAIISSRLASYLKRPCWSALSPCPLAKELETVHPRRTYFFLTTQPRQSLPDLAAIVQPVRAAVITPSVSLTDDSGSDDVEGRRRELSPSPEVDLSPHELDEASEDIGLPGTPLGSFSSQRMRVPRDFRHDSPPLEKDEREFTQTADVLLKRKLSEEKPALEAAERLSLAEYGFRDDMWFGDSRGANTTTFLASPAIKPSGGPFRGKEDEASENWLKLNMLFEWDQGAESIEIDELDCLLDAC